MCIVDGRIQTWSFYAACLLLKVIVCHKALWINVSWNCYASLDIFYLLLLTTWSPPIPPHPPPSDYCGSDPALLPLGNQCLDWSDCHCCVSSCTILCGHEAVPNTEEHSGEHIYVQTFGTAYIKISFHLVLVALKGMAAKPTLWPIMK